MAGLNKRSIDKLREMRDITDRYGNYTPNIPASIPLGDKPPALIGRIDSGPDSGMWTGRIVRFDVYTQTWVVASQWDVKFLRTNADDPAPQIGRRYACRPSHININEANRALDEYVYDLLPTAGSGSTFVIIDDSLGTGTHNTQGRSEGRVATYDVDTDSWSYSTYTVLIEPLNPPGYFVVGRRYPAWYAGEATGGYDGTGTGTLGTGTGTAGGTLPVYIVDTIGTRLDVVTDITVECVGGDIVTTITRRTIIALYEP